MTPTLSIKNTPFDVPLSAINFALCRSTQFWASHNTVRHQVVGLEKPFSNFMVDKSPTLYHLYPGVFSRYCIRVVLGKYPQMNKKKSTFFQYVQFCTEKRWWFCSGTCVTFLSFWNFSADGQQLLSFVRYLRIH